MVKYRITNILIFILILVVIGACVYLDFFYLDRSDKVKVENVQLQISTSDIQLIDEVQDKLIKNEKYQSLVSVELPDDFVETPGGKTNPFDVSNNEED